MDATLMNSMSTSSEPSRLSFSNSDINCSLLENNVFSESTPGLSSEQVQSLLWPCPQCLSLQDGHRLVLPKDSPIKLLSPSGSSTIASVPLLMRTWKRYEDSFMDLGHQISFQYSITEDDDENSPIVVCGINRDLFCKDESYILAITEHTVHLNVSDMNALNHGIRTLIQLVVIFKDEPGIPLLQIRDWPSFQHRALKINITAKSTRVPKMETLRVMLQTWSKLKFNQLHLHCSLSMEAVRQIPYTPMEMLDFENMCNECGVSLVPSVDLESKDQKITEILIRIKEFLQSFTCIRYIALGETLLSALTADGSNLQNLLPFDLSRATLVLPSSFMSTASTAFKLQAVQVTEPSEVAESTKPSEKYCQCLLLNPLNRSSICHFDAGRISDVNKWIQRAFDDNHLGAIVSPSTSFYWTLPVAFLAPTLLALGLTWNHQSHTGVDIDSLSRYLNRHLLCDKGDCVGHVLMDMASTETIAPTLWCLLEDPDSTDIEKYTGHVFQRVIRQLLSCQAMLHKLELCCPRSGEIQAEVQLLTDLLIFAARIGKHLVSMGTNPNSNYGVSVINVGIANLPPTAKTDLANKLLGLIEQFRSTWMNSYLPDSLEMPLSKLNNLLNHLVPPENVNIIQ